MPPVLFIAASCLLAQVPAPQAPATPEEPKKPVLENTGKPMRVAFQCTDEDMRSFGLTCPAHDPCPVYLELAAVQPVGDKVFLVGNIHTESTTLSSILLASSDGGKSWQEPYERIRSAGLDQIQFLDFAAGWIGGQLLLAFPRDPFLLLTTDGGQTWRRRPVSSEDRVGAIEQFWFTSRTQGTLWLDRTQSGETESRYELYESQTGGESWMLREVSSRPLQKAKRPAPASDWRLRTDSRSRAFVIERRQAERWLPVAGFLVRIGECKEAEHVLPEPPPEPAPTEEPKTAAPKPTRRPPSLKKPPK